MAQFNIPLYSFSSGTLGINVKGHQDLEIIKSGSLISENFITIVEGPRRYRSGFGYITHTRNFDRPWFLPFVFSDQEAYNLVFTDGYLRFYSDNGVITETEKTITAITKASPGVLTIASHGYSTGDEVYISGVGGMVELVDNFYLVVKIDANTFSLTDLDGTAIDTSAFTTFTSGGTSARVYELETPYSDDDLENIHLAGVADVRYLVDGKHAIRKLTRSGSASWTLSTYTRTSDPFGAVAITAVTQANPGQVTAAGHGFSNGDSVIIEDVVGMTELNGNTYTVTVVDVDNFTIGVNTSAYTAYSSGGAVAKENVYPATVAVYGGRLVFGGVADDPNTLFGSRSPNPSTGQSRYDDFTTGSNPDDAVIQTLSSLTGNADKIHWFIGTRQFLGVGTFGGLIKVNGGADGAAITGDGGIAAFPIDSYGASTIRPVSFGSDILYVQRGNEVIFSFQYSFVNESFESLDETIQNPEVGSAGVRQLAYQQGRPNLVWLVMDDGSLRSLTYKKSESLSAWDYHYVGGGGEVVTAVGQPQENNQDYLWIGVKRVIDGNTRYYIERSALNEDLPERDNIYTGDEDADNETYLDLVFESQMRQNHLDSSLELDTTQYTTITPSATTGSDVTFTAGSSIFSSSDAGRQIRVKHLVGGETGIAIIHTYTSATQVKAQIVQDFESTSAIPSGGWYFTQDTVSGLDHLEGETVSIIANGGVDPEQTVSGGTVSLGGQTAYAIVGLPYTGRIKSMPISLVMSAGITFGKPVNVGEILFYFHNALGTSYGTNPYDLNRIIFRTGGDYSGRPEPPFNGFKRYPGFGDHNEESFVYIVQTVPLPCTILGYVLDTEVAFNSGA